MTLSVGVGTVDISPPPGFRMAGYGARSQLATATLAPLTARLLHLRQGQHQQVVVALDAVAVGAQATAVIRARLADALGCAPTSVLVAATHTHSGISLMTGAGVPPWLDGSDEPGRIDRIADAVVGAARTATGEAAPARLAVGTFWVPGVGANRREPAASAGDTFRLVVAEHADDGRPVTVMVIGEVHPTILEADNVQYSPDYPGAVRATVERMTGAPTLFLTGAAGDVNPVWTEHTAEEAERVGSIIGLRAAEAVLRLRRLGQPHRVVNLSLGRDLEVHQPDGHRIEPVQLDAAVAVLRLRERVGPDLSAAEARIRGLENELDAAPGDARLLARAHQARIEHLLASGGHAPAGDERAAEVQMLRLGSSCVLLGLPGEFFVETRRRLSAALPGQQLLVAGYANDYLSYVPPASAFADAGYEVGCARLPEDAEQQIVAAALALARDRG
jgi:neutral ceramidase